MDTGETCTVGCIDNMKVVVSMAGVSIKGSLAKYFFPDNTYTLTRNNVKEAIIKMSDVLHLDMMKAMVKRIDVSTNFIMKHETGLYYDVLGNCKNLKRTQMGDETVYYNSKSSEKKMEMVFYNKAREVENRRGELPEVYAGANMLRYESRWSSRLPQQLNEAEITGQTLYDARFYGKIIGLWADGYFRIEKRRTLNYGAMEKIKTVSDATDFICAMALQKLNPDEVQNIMEEMKRRNVFEDRKYYTRLKEKIKTIGNKAEFTDVDILAKELDGEVRNVLAYKR